MSEGVKLSRINLEALVGEAALRETSSLAALAWVKSLPLLIEAPTEESLECWTVGPWRKEHNLLRHALKLVTALLVSLQTVKKSLPFSFHGKQILKLVNKTKPAARTIQLQLK